MFSLTGVYSCTFSCFFFQAEDGIRDHCVTGVQTCALPISAEKQAGLFHARSAAMSISAFGRGWFIAAVAAWMAIAGGRAQAQDIAPVNSGANPYRAIRDWAQLTLEKRPWGGSNGVAIDRDGRSVWATDRCSPGTAPGCLGTKANPIHHFDEQGKEIRSFGGGMFVWPHGIHVDRDGNVWVTDASVTSPDTLAKVPGEETK